MDRSAAVLFLFAFSASASFTLKEVPRAYETVGSQKIVATDLDLDGNVDVVAFGGIQGSILYGRADGTFEPAVAFGDAASTPDDPTARVLVADFDGDRYPDLVFVSWEKSAALMLRNLGGRKFEEKRIFNGTGSVVAAADFTSDGAPDLLFDAYPDSILLINDGHGAFTANRVISGMSFRGVASAAGDFDGDGDLDLAAGGLTLNVFSNDGSGRFVRTSQREEPRIAIPIAADLDRDRVAEMIMLRYYSTEIVLWSGSGVQAQSKTMVTGPRPSNATVGDFNNDGLPDLAVLHEGDDSSVDIRHDAPLVITFLGDGRGGLTRASEVIVPWMFRTGIAAADVNHDHALDLLVQSGNAVGVVLGNGDGTFRVPAQVPGLPHHSIKGTVDFNGDGIDELLLAPITAEPFKVAWMNENGTYRFEIIPAVTWNAYSPMVAGGGKLLVGENNIIHVLSASEFGVWKDDRIDAGGAVTTMQLWRERIAAVTVTSGTSPLPMLKVFSPAGALIFSYSLSPSPAKDPSNRNPFRIDAADVDRDGRMDLIVTAFPSTPTWFHDRTLYTDASIQLFRGRADGTFAPPELLLVDRPLYKIAVADMNGDGTTDIAFDVVGVPADQRFKVLSNDGSGHFVEQPSALGFTPELVADFNLDGVLDFKSGPTIVYSGVRAVRYVDSMLGSVLVRRKRGGPASLAGMVPERGSIFFEELAPDTNRGRAVRH